MVYSESSREEDQKQVGGPRNWTLEYLKNVWSFQIEFLTIGTAIGNIQITMFIDVEIIKNKVDFFANYFNMDFPGHRHSR